MFISFFIGEGDVVLLSSAKFNQKNKSLAVPILPGLKLTKSGVGGYLCLYLVAFIAL